MMKKIFSLIYLLLSFVSFSQGDLNDNIYPIFDACKEVAVSSQESCFYKEVQKQVYTNFVLAEKFQEPDFNAEINTVFSVNKEGQFSVLYVDAPHSELQDEMKRVFENFPKVIPVKDKGQGIFSKYTLKFNVPFGATNKELLKHDYKVKKNKEPKTITVGDKELENEFANMGYVKYTDPKFNSAYNIPFTHSSYARFDDEINRVGVNNHTASKPLSYHELKKYYDFKAELDTLKFNKKSWWGRKLLNENMIAFQTEDYWFTLDLIWDLRMGKDNESDVSYTFHNTRGVQAQAGLGRNLSFTTTIFESQGRFADYYNSYARSIRPARGNPATIPGVGIAKNFKEDSFDFPSADANIMYAPSKMIDVQLGYGRNFLGDGYRSMLLGDATSPYPYLKINTKFWKLKYTNTYTSLKDTRADVIFDKTYATKYMVNHYLSYNVNKRLNIGFFESVIWSNNNQRGFDANFLNPVIFYRTVEFNSSSRSGNAMLGLTTKYKFSNSVNLYGQFLLDEFSLATVKAQEGNWKSKYGTQLGLKYYNALGVDNLLFQLEYNMARPYTYSHSEAITNYGHNNQSLAHLWSTNFRELIFIVRYNKGRLFADVKINSGVRGYDYDTSSDVGNYGGDIYKSYEVDRPYDKGIEVGNGNKATVLIGDINVGYIVNPSTNLKLFVNLIYRDFVPETSTKGISTTNTEVFEQSTMWISAGIRTDLFNFYTDF